MFFFSLVPGVLGEEEMFGFCRQRPLWYPKCLLMMQLQYKAVLEKHIRPHARATYTDLSLNGTYEWFKRTSIRCFFFSFLYFELLLGMTEIHQWSLNVIAINLLRGSTSGFLLRCYRHRGNGVCWHDSLSQSECRNTTISKFRLCLLTSKSRTWSSKFFFLLWHFCEWKLSQFWGVNYGNEDISQTCTLWTGDIHQGEHFYEKCMQLRELGALVQANLMKTVQSILDKNTKMLLHEAHLIVQIQKKRDKKNTAIILSKINWFVQFIHCVVLQKKSSICPVSSHIQFIF